MPYLQLSTLLEVRGKLDCKSSGEELGINLGNGLHLQTLKEQGTIIETQERIKHKTLLLHFTLHLLC